MSKSLTNQVFLRANALSINNITINAPQNITYTWTLPNTVGNSGEFLTTDGTGVLSWTSTPVISGVLTVGGLIDNSLTASQAVFTNAAKRLVSVATTGTGSVVLAGDPTLTGTTTVADLIDSGLTNSSAVATDGSKKLVSVGLGTLKLSTGTTDYSLLGTLATDGTTNTRIVVSGNTRSGAAGGIDYVATSTGGHVWTAGGGIRMTLTSGGNLNIAGLTISNAVFTDASKNLISVATNGTGNVVLTNAPTLTGSVTISNTISGTVANSLLILNPSNTVNSISSMSIGKANTTGNGQIFFTHKADADPTNTLTLGFVGGGGGKFTISNSTSTATTLNAPLTVTGKMTSDSINVTGLSASNGVFTDASKNLISAPAYQLLTATFIVPSLSIPLPTSINFAKITIVFSTSVTTDITISGNTLANGTGTNLTTNEPYEQLQQSSGVVLLTNSGIIADNVAANISAMLEVTVITTSVGTTPRKQYFVHGAYTTNGVGTTRVDCSGYLASTALSLVLTPTSGLLTGSWYYTY